MLPKADGAFERSRRGYDRLAPLYEGLEYIAFGSALMRARTTLLETLPPLRKSAHIGRGGWSLFKGTFEGPATLPGNVRRTEPWHGAACPRSLSKESITRAGQFYNSGCQPF